MTLARIVGTVVSAQRADELESPTYLLAEECDQHGKPNGGILVVLDPVGTERGEMVIYARGSSVRWILLTDDKPIDALIVGQVEMIDEEGSVTYQRNTGA